MKITKSLANRLTHVVPGYIWRQGYFAFTPDQNCHQVIKQRQGLIIVGSPSLPRAEYALAWCLGQVLSQDYHAKISWLSFYPKEPHSFTDSVKTPQLTDTVAVSIKELECLDQVRDIVATTKLAFVASSLPPLTLASRLHLPVFALMHISANSARKVTV